MTNRRPFVAVLGIIVLAVVLAGAYGLWYIFLRPSGPPPVIVGGGSSTAPSSTGAGSSATPDSSSSGGGSTAGTWTIDDTIGSTSDNSETFVGYRVQEQLVGIGGNTAVGRTSSVTGTLAVVGTQVTVVDVTADLTTLHSDDPQRDGQLARQGIQTEQFPTAEFKLSSPIQLSALPADGGPAVTAMANGQLTLHGVTKDIEIQVSATLSGGIVTVTGSTTIVFADYGISPPNSFKVLSVDDHGIMEFQLHFRHA